MVGRGGSGADSYLADPTSPISSHCASIVVNSTLRVNRHIHLIFCSEILKIQLFCAAMNVQLCAAVI